MVWLAWTSRASARFSVAPVGVPIRSADVPMRPAWASVRIAEVSRVVAFAPGEVVHGAFDLAGDHVTMVGVSTSVADATIATVFARAAESVRYFLSRNTQALL